LFQRHRGEVALLLTDVVMPGVNGFQLAEHIATIRPGLPVVFMSGAMLTRDDPREPPLLRNSFCPRSCWGAFARVYRPGAKSVRD